MSYSPNIGHRCSFFPELAKRQCQCDEEENVALIQVRILLLCHRTLCSVSSGNDSFSFFDVVDSRNENGAICSIKENFLLTPLRNVMHLQTFGILSNFSPALSKPPSPRNRRPHPGPEFPYMATCQPEIDGLHLVEL